MLKAATHVLLATVLAACSPPGPKITLGDGWARETGRSDMAAAYVTIDNRGGADELKGLRSTIGVASLHESAMDNGIMRMRPIEAGQGLIVPSNGRLVLAPGGAHVMIAGLKQPLKAGDRFGLTLLFAKSKPHRVVIWVKPAAEERQ